MHGVCAASGIESVAVGQRGFRALLAQEVAQPGRKIGPDVSHVSGFAEMKLHGHKLIFEFNVEKTGTDAEPFQLVEKIGVGVGTQVGEINF